MVYNGIGFNAKWVASKTLEEFKKHEAHHKLTDEQYKEAWELCKKEVEGKASPAAKAEEVKK